MRVSRLVIGLVVCGLAGCASSKSKRTTPQARRTDNKTVKKSKKNPPKNKPKIVSNPKDWGRYQGRIVRRIAVSGLKRTRVWRLKHLIDTREGRPFDLETFRHDLRRIRNTELFRDLRVRVDPDGKAVVVRFHMIDKWSLLPFFNLFFNLGTVNVLAGVYDVNTLGFLSYVDLQLILFSYLPVTSKSIRPGGVLSLGIQRIGGLPLRYDFDARAQMTIRTIIGSGPTVAGSFQAERYGGYHSLSYEPFQWLRVGLRQLILYNRYKLAEESITPTVPMPESGLTHSLALTLSFGYTAYRNYMLHGLQLDLVLEGSDRALGSDFDYVKLYGSARGYYDLGDKGGNLAVRIAGGYMTGGGYDNLYTLGSWTGLRGFYTGQFSARSYVVANFEYRTGLLPIEFPIIAVIPYFRGKVLRMQGVIFADIGAVAGAGPYRTTESGRPLVSVGAGFRGAFIKFYRAILRVDFAYTLSPYRSYDLIVSTQQYF